MNRNKKVRKKQDRAEENTNFFDQFYRKCLQDEELNKKEYDSSCKLFLKRW